MCTQGKFITNKYSGAHFWCTCGKCDACKQKKAAFRASRIRNEYDGKSLVYFITLTYDRMSLPFIKLDDYLRLQPVDTPQSLIVYRKKTVKWNIGLQKYVSTYKITPLEEFIFDDASCCCWSDEAGVHHSYIRPAAKTSNSISVVYFKDIQDFKKRLRQNLSRYYGYKKSVRIFNVTEYGGTTYRAHHHLLLYAEGLSQATIHSAVIKSWPFGNRVRDPKSCQLVEGDPAGYVASYVNSGENLSPLLARYFKQRHSHSRFFGHNVPAFSLEKIQEKALAGNLEYSVGRVKQGVFGVDNFLIPKYVINRWFPLFKGYSRLDGNQVCEFLARNADTNYLGRIASEYDASCIQDKRFRELINYEPARYNLKDGKYVLIQPSDLYKIKTRFEHAFKSYRHHFPDASWFDYARMYKTVWNTYKSTSLRRFEEDDTVPRFYKYDNICLLSPNQQWQLYEQLSDHQIPFIVDNNKKPPVVQETIKLKQYYHKYCKQKECTGAVLNAAGFWDM